MSPRYILSGLVPEGGIWQLERALVIVSTVRLNAGRSRYSAPMFIFSTVTLKTVRRENCTLKSSLGIEALNIGVKEKLSLLLLAIRLISVYRAYPVDLQPNPLTLI